MLNPGKDECLIQAIIRKYWGMIVDNIFLGFQKSGTKSRGVLHFVPLRRFYAVLFVPLFCRLREKWGTWMHNVDNMRQKDIKMSTYNITILYCQLYLQKYREQSYLEKSVFNGYSSFDTDIFCISADHLLLLATYSYISSMLWYSFLIKQCAVWHYWFM